MEIKVVKSILEANDTIARENSRLFDAASLFVANIMGPPGSGKTSLIETTLARLGPDIKVGVIEGDIASTRDSDRLSALGIPVIQINTEGFGGECHLDANMVRNAIGNFPLDGLDILLVENVGNLVCPAEFNLGEDLKVMLLSTPEGEELIFKYPIMFRVSEALLVNKWDLVAYCPFDLKRFAVQAQRINPDLKVFAVSARTGEGIEGWCTWLMERRAKQRKRPPQ
jgi:hydrogenase nickel incorporation protein HypB